MQEDFQCTPFLVRRVYVLRALEWLKLNHADYSDLVISMKNLAEYPEDSPPVTVEYKISSTNKTAEMKVNSSLLVIVTTLNLFITILNYIHKCFHGFFHMV